MKKRIVASLLTCSMLCCSSIPAFAEEGTDDGTKVSLDLDIETETGTGSDGLDEINARIDSLEKQLAELYSQRNQKLIESGSASFMENADDTASQFILDYTEFVNQFDTKYLVWRVRNPFDYPISLKFTVNYLDSNGAVIERENSTRYFIAPGKQSIIFLSQTSKFDTIQLSAEYKKSQYIEAIDPWISYTVAGDERKPTYTFVNNSDKTMYSVYAIWAFIKDGKIIDVTKNLIPDNIDLEPGEEGYSQIYPPDEYDSVEIYYDGGFKE